MLLRQTRLSVTETTNDAQQRGIKAAPDAIKTPFNAAFVCFLQEEGIGPGCQWFGDKRVVERHSS